MRRLAMIASVLFEYGFPWAVNRVVYAGKLQMLKLIPTSEKMFEPKSNTTVKRLDIFDINSNDISCYLKTLPTEKKAELIKTADDACNGKIHGFSSITLNYGNPINWHLNPLTGISCDSTLKWFRIPDFDIEKGDIKAIWEASRFTHFFAFARAYLLTGDIKYYLAYSKQLEEWLCNNRYSYGVNYKCGQECAIRLITCLMVYTVFNDSGLTSERDKTNVKELISCCYKKIISNFYYTYRCIKNNHTISELIGMIIGAWCCENEKGVIKGYQLFDKEISKQFTKDGGYKQFSFNYQRMVLQLIECLMSIAPKTGHQIGHEAQSRALKSSFLLYQCQNNDGKVPNYGSNDGSFIFPVTSGDYRDYRSVVNCIHVLVSNSRLFRSGLYDEELLWFAGGIEKCEFYFKPRVSSCFPEAGLYVMRSQNSYMMLVLNDFKSRPAHMDQMHVDLWVDGINVFCDSGSYSYANDLGKKLASTSGHNTVKVSGIEQMNRQGAFLLYDWTTQRNFRWRANLIESSIISANGYTHSRSVEIMDTGYKIKDKVKVKSGKSYTSLFHTPCDIEKIGNKLYLYSNGKLVCHITVESDEIKIDKTERSQHYLQYDSINCIHIIGNKNDSEVTIYTK